MISTPTIADLARMTALMCAARYAVRTILPLLSDSEETVSALADRLEADEALVRLGCKSLGCLGLATVEEAGVRRLRSVDSREIEGIQAVLDYYSDFASRPFPSTLQKADSVGDYYGLLEHVADPTARLLMRRYEPQPPLSILDYGCGLAPHTIQLLRAFPESSATLIERQEVLPLVKRRVEEEGLEGRVRLFSVRGMQASAAGPFDLVLILNVLHELPRQEQESVLHLLAALTSGRGELAVQVFCRDLAPEWHSDALEMATAIRIGSCSDVLRRSEYEAVLGSAKMRVAQKADLRTVGGPANILLLAQREDED